MEVKKKINHNQINESGLGNIKESFDKKISNRYKLHDLLTDLLYRYEFSKKHKALKYCGKALINKDDKISMEIKQGESVTFRNIVYCKNPDICPVCASTEQSKRANTIIKAIEYAHSNGMTVYMLTLTAPHYFNTDYLAFSKQLQSGYSKLISAIKRMVKDGELKYSLMGHIQNFEVTYSTKNGYHPHKHCLLFFDSVAGVDEKELEKDVKKAWKKICRKNGLLDNADNVDFDDKAVNIELCRTAHNYLQKIHHEMTSKTNKAAKNNNMSYFTALNLLYELKKSSNDVKKIKQLEQIIIGFIKIFDVTESLRFSKGFRTIVENYIDSLPADEEPEPVAGVNEVETIEISKTTWEYIVQHKLRPELIAKAIEGGADKVRLWLAMLGFRLRYSLYDCAIGA